MTSKQIKEEETYPEYSITIVEDIEISAPDENNVEIGSKEGLKQTLDDKRY